MSVSLRSIPFRSGVSPRDDFHRHDEFRHHRRIWTSVTSFVAYRCVPTAKGVFDACSIRHRLHKTCVYARARAWVACVHARVCMHAHMHLAVLLASQAPFPPPISILALLILQTSRFLCGEAYDTIPPPRDCRLYAGTNSLTCKSRDIKPDNILLDRGGHIKLTDFGLSTGFHPQHENSYYQQLLKGSSSKPRDRSSVLLDQINLTVSNRGQINTWRKSRRVMAYSTVGTPDYIAPEIFIGEGYAFSCDWWSVGAIMFECLVGWPPFCAEDPHDTYRKIVDWPNTLYFPEDIPLGREAESLIRA